MEFETLLQHFGWKIGLDNLHLDDEGICSLGFDDLVVHVKTVDDGRRVFLFGKVTDMPKELEYKVLRALLKGNYLFQATKMATLSINEDGTQIFLQQLEAIGLLNEELFAKLVEDFVNMARLWKELIAEAVQSGVPDDGENSADSGTNTNVLEQFELLMKRV